MPYSGNAQIELTRLSAFLEERLKPITAEMNAFPLRVNCETWQCNLGKAEEVAAFNNSYCEFLSGDPEFRPNSAADCSKALAAKGHEPRYNKETKRVCVDKDVLSELSTQGEVLADAVLAARSAISRLSQLRAWAPYARAGWVKPTWDSLGTPHGRYTSDAPCLNNRIDLIRETIEPDPGYLFLSLDYSQAEYVTWGSLSQDPTLSRLFIEGRDFHVEMARAIRKLVPNWDLRGQDEREAGKTINFSILYQMQGFTLARKLGCSVDIALKIIDAYYERIPTAKIYISSVLAAAEYLGYCDTFYGRRRHCPEYAVAGSGRDQHELEKTLWSHHNAGSAAEYVKFKTVRIWEALRLEDYDEFEVRLALNMYDEILFHVRAELLDEVKALILPIWTRQESDFLPFKSTINEGDTWGKASK